MGRKRRERKSERERENKRGTAQAFIKEQHAASFLVLSPQGSAELVSGAPQDLSTDQDRKLASLSKPRGKGQRGACLATFLPWSLVARIRVTSKMLLAS